jgi:hypothetical protein
MITLYFEPMVYRTTSLVIYRIIFRSAFALYKLVIDHCHIAYLVSGFYTTSGMGLA